jgi:hypothetical protein
MYFVIYAGVLGTGVESFEYLLDAQERVQELVEKGCMQVHVAQEIPLKVTVKVEF